MEKINKMIIYTVIQTIFVILICVFSFLIFNNLKLENVQEEIHYTNMEIIHNENAYIAVDNFSDEEQLRINLVNESITYENYSILLTCNINLEEVDQYIYIKIDNKSYILEDLLVKDNYYQILNGKIKALNKEIKIYLAVNNKYTHIFEDGVGFNFVNENILI